MSVSKSKQSFKGKNKPIKIDSNKEISYKEFQEDILLEELESKENQIYDLLSKIKTQDGKIELLNKEMEEKDLNIYTIEQNYKIQLEELKKLLGFTGNIDNLLKKKEQSYEYEFAKAIKETQSDNSKKDIKIEQLKSEIKILERENEQLHIFIEIKKNNETMLEILKSIENNKNIEKENVETKNNEEILVKNLIKKNRYLTKKIHEIKNNINKGIDIRKSLPDSLIPATVTPNLNKNDKKCEINDLDKEDLEKKLEKLREKEKNETKILLNKYLSIMEQNKNEIIKGNDYFNNKINIIYGEKIKKYEEEIIRVFNLIQKIIKIYNKSFSKTCSLYLMKGDYDKLLKEELSNINALNFPLLFKMLKNCDYFNPKKKYQKISKKKLSLISLNSNDDDNDNKKEAINNLDNKDNDCFSVEDLIAKKKSLFLKIEKKTEEQLNNLSKDDLSAYVLKFGEFINNCDELINKYISNKCHQNYKKIYKESNNSIKTVKQKINEINNKINVYNEKQNHLNIVLEYTSKIIQRLKKENIQLKQRIKDSLLNEQSVIIPLVKIDKKNYNNKNDFFKKPLTTRNSIINNNNTSRSINIQKTQLSTDRRFVNNINKVYKILV